MFCYCYYVHYAMITRKNKLILIPTLLSLHNCHENKTTAQFSFQHYFHYTIVMRIKLLHNYHEKKTAIYFPSESSVVLKESYMVQ